MAKKITSKSSKVKIGAGISQRMVLILIVGVIAVFGSVLITRSFAATAGTLYMTPATGSYKVGDVITVTVRENSNADEVKVVQADVLYVASQLEYVSSSCSTAFNEVALPPTLTPGQVSSTCANLSVSRTGDQAVEDISFRVLTTGPTTLNFAPTSIVYRTSDSTNAAGSTTGATYKLTKVRGGGKH